MSNTRDTASEKILALDYDFSMSPDQTMGHRAIALAGLIAAEDLSPVGISDNIPQRGICLCHALKWHGIEAVLTDVSGSWKRAAMDSGCSVDAKHTVNVEIFGEDGVVYAGADRELFLSKDPLSSWEKELTVFGRNPIPDNTWTHGSRDCSMILADSIIELLKHTIGQTISRTLRLGAHRTLPNSILFKRSEDVRRLPAEASVWAKRLSALGFDITGDGKISERLSIPRNKEATEGQVTWNRHNQVLCSAGGEFYALSPSCSLSSIARCSLQRKPVVFAIPRIATSSQTTDIVVSGKKSKKVESILRERGFSVEVVKPNEKRIPSAKCFVACDTTKETADLALSALMSGLVPIVPPTYHSGLWAVQNIVAKLVDNEAAEMAEMAAQVCRVNSRVFDAWRLRGTDGWGSLLAIGGPHA